MQVTFYFIDGSRSFREYIKEITELRDGTIQLTPEEDPETKEAHLEFFAPEHIALMQIRKDDND